MIGVGQCLMTVATMEKVGSFVGGGCAVDRTMQLMARADSGVGG